MSVNEVRKGDFVYRDTLFVDPGGDKRHPRASVAELRNLLLPKKGQAPPRDEVGHWYEAQLLHYGLPRTKDKNTAKVRLTSSIAAGSLAVPAHIIQMEADMKKEFAAANRKAKATTKKVPETTPVNNGKKRKANDTDSTKASSSATKMSITVGDVTVNIDHRGDTQTESKKRKVTTPATKKSSEPKPIKESKTSTKQPKPKTQASVPPTTASTSKSTKKDSTTSKPKQTAQKSTSTVTPAPTRKLQTARRGRPFNPSSNSRASLNDKKSSGVPGQYIKDEDIDMKDTSPYDSSNHDYKHSDDDEVKPHPQVQVSGIYNIKTVYDDMTCELTLVKDPQTNQFWGHFDAADQRGVLHIPDTTGIASQEAVQFWWRAQDEGLGTLRFKRDQDGWIQFDGEGRARGCWNRLSYGQDLEFEGYLDDEPDRSVHELIERWEWFVDAAYGR